MYLRIRSQCNEKNRKVNKHRGRSKLKKEEKKRGKIKKGNI